MKEVIIYNIFALLSSTGDGNNNRLIYRTKRILIHDFRGYQFKL